MGAYTPNTLTAEAARTASEENTERTKLQTAINTMTSANFPAGSNGQIPNAALANGDSVFVVKLKYDRGDVGINHTNATDSLDEIPMPRACTVTAVKAETYDVGAVHAATAQVDVFNRTSGATILSSPITLEAVHTTYSGTVSASSVAANDILSLRIITDGTGHLDGVTVSIECQVAHVA